MSEEKKQGGALGGVDDLYREVILDHFKAPKNKGDLPDANTRSEGVNPLCGDQITISARIENGEIADIRFSGHGCAISQSAASMMTQLVKGKPIATARDLASLFKSMFGLKDAEPAPGLGDDDLGDAIALEGVKRYPVRVKCATLSWNTLMQALESGSKREK